MRGLLPFLVLAMLFSKPFTATGQTAIDVDAFQQELNTIPYPERVDSLVAKVSKKARTFSAEEKSSMVSMAIEDLEQLDKHPRHLATLYVTQIILFTQTGKRQLCAPWLVKTQKLIDQFGEDTKEWNFIRGRVHHLMSFNYYFENKSQKAIDEAEVALSYFRLCQDTLKMADLHSAIGVYSSEAGDSEKAIEYYDGAIALLEHTDHEFYLIGAKFYKSVDLILLLSLIHISEPTRPY